MFYISAAKVTKNGFPWLVMRNKVWVSRIYVVFLCKFYYH